MNAIDREEENIAFILNFGVSRFQQHFIIEILEHQLVFLTRESIYIGKQNKG
jgi:hypothetical protein